MSNPFFVKIQTFTLHFHKISVEIKSAATFTGEFLKGIERFRKVVGDRYSQGFVLYNGSEKFTLKKIQIFNPLLHGGLGHEHRNGAGLE